MIILWYRNAYIVSPEVASVGLTEEEAKEKGYKLKVGKFSFRAIGKALVYGESDGFVKLVVDEETNDILVFI